MTDHALQTAPDVCQAAVHGNDDRHWHGRAHGEVSSWRAHPMRRLTMAAEAEAPSMVSNRHIAACDSRDLVASLSSNDRRGTIQSSARGKPATSRPGGGYPPIDDCAGSGRI